MIPRCLLLLGLMPAAVLAAVPRSEDFAQGIVLHAEPDRPVLELVLPDAVYRGVTATDLRDLMVFNADSVPVPHALCHEPKLELPQIELRELPLYTISDRTIQDPETSVQVETAAGTTVQVEESGGNVTTGGAHVIDARGQGELRALSLDWSSPDGANEARVRVLASSNLDSWQTLTATTLLHAQQGSSRLEQQRIPLPQQSYTYLRLERVDPGPPLAIQSARGEWVQPGPENPPHWFTAVPLADPEELVYETARLAPVSFARVLLPGDNMAVQLELESRPDPQSPWRSAWHGEIFSLTSETGERHSPDPRFAPTFDRFWRIASQAGSLLDPTVHPILELGYLPARLRFLAQGPGPYLLAYGSRRAETVAPRSCDSLLSDLRADDLASLLGTVQDQPPHPLGGNLALTPLPRPTPVRQIVLWAVLIAGTLLLVWMAITLFQRMRRDAAGSTGVPPATDDPA